MTAPVSEEIKEVNVLMTFFIVALHVFAWEERMWPLRALVNIAVPVFFVISAYLYFQNWTFSWACYWKKLKRRFFSLYIPFVAYNALYVPFILFKSHVLHAADTRQLSVWSPEMVTNILFGWPIIPDAVLWFLRVLLIFAFVAPLIGLAVRYSKWSFVAISAVCFAFAPHFPYISFFYWLPCLSFGALLAFHEDSLKRLSAHTNKWAATAFFSGYILFFSYFLRGEDVFDSPYYYFYRMVVPLVAVPFFLSVGRLLPSRLVDSVHPYTFPIYCMHVPIVNFAVMALSKVFPPEYFVLTQVLAFLLAFSLTLGLCMILRRIKPVWAVLSGFRTARK